MHARTNHKRTAHSTIEKNHNRSDLRLLEPAYMRSMSGRIRALYWEPPHGGHRMQSGEQGKAVPQTPQSKLLHLSIYLGSAEFYTAASVS